MQLSKLQLIMKTNNNISKLFNKQHKLVKND